MKKSLIALAALATVATAAQAQSSVTVYGVMDVGVATVNHVNGNAAAGGNKTWTGMSTGNEATSRLGFMGTEDLGGGLKANFKLESQLFPTTGEVGSTSLTTMNTQSQTVKTGTNSASSSVSTASFFDRNATVGLAGNFGTINLGRQNNVQYDKLVAFDPRGYGNFAGMGSMGINKLSRVDNSVKYSSPTFYGVSVDALYSTAGVAGKADAGTATEFAVNYVNGSAKVVAAYAQLNTLCTGNLSTGTTGSSANGANGEATTLANEAYCSYFGSASTTPGGLASGSRGIEQRLIAGSYAFGAFTGTAGYLSKRNLAAAMTVARNESNLYWAGVKYQVNPLNALTVAYYSVDDHAVVGGQKPSMLAIDYQYSLSKRTSLYAIAGFVHNDAATKLSVTDNGKVSVNGTNNGALPTTGTNQTGYTVGLKHSF